MSEERKKRLALVASKGSLDQAYPPLMLASTAVALGWEVGVFFTFFGLDIINKHKQARLQVAPIANPAFPPPIPAVPLHVPNVVGMLPGMTGVATSFMKRWMSDAKMPSITELLEITMEGGGQLFACTTTMGVMHVSEADLIDGVSCRGAAAFLDFAAGADVSLFI
ncbi:MAG: DsrE/DsrF/DrsH-like family protein [Anaerolineae bacterium]